MVLQIIKICVLLATLSSCSSFQKWKDKLQGRNQIVGLGTENLVNTSMDEGKRGSDSGAISGLSTVFFPLDSSELSHEIKETLKENVRWLKSNSSVVRMELEGHCDYLGSEAYNIGLGQRRAKKVKTFLKEQGVPESKLEVISFGEEKPLSQTNTAKNRRVNFVPIY